LAANEAQAHYREADFALQLAQRYHELGEKIFFLQAFRQYKIAEEALPLQNAERLSLTAAAEKLWFLATTDKQRTADTNVQAILDAQEKHFVAMQLKMICTAISYQNIHKKEYDFGLLDALLRRIIAHNWQETEPAIGAYFYIYKMNTEAESESFFKVLKSNLGIYAGVFDKEEQQNCYIFAINYAIKQCNKGDKAFFRQLFELYKEGVETGVLLAKNAELSPYTYKNMVATGLRVGESAYIFSFLEKYKTALPIEHRANYYEYCLARYYFKIKDYENALPLLLKLTYGDVFLQLDAKVTLMKIYYETSNFDSLDAHLRSFQQFLVRKKTTLVYHQQNYLNIIACAKQLLAAKYAKKVEKETLKTLIETTQPLTEREWFLSVL
jgi:hypothetical protein